MAIVNESVPDKAERKQDRDIPNKASGQTSDVALNAATNARRTEWYRRPFWLGLSGAMLLYAAFPPLGLWPAAWVAPVFWIALIRQPRLAGKRPYLALWLAGTIYWLVLYYFIPIPFWGLYFGWAAMSAYLAVYLPLFVGLTRVAVHRLKLSVIFAAPVIWTGLELVRGHLFTGLSMSLLGHTQVEWLAIIQVADLAGAYAVSFTVMLVAACLGRMLPPSSERAVTWPAIPALAVLAACLLYGTYRLNQSTSTGDARVARVALIQGSIDTVFDLTPEEAMQRQQNVFETYRKWTEAALIEHPETNLIIWPESKFTVPDVIRMNSKELPYDLPTDGSVATNHDQVRALALTAIGNSSGQTTGAHFLAGTQTVQLDPSTTRHFNTALLMNSHGEIEDRYFKMHRVLFGEYVPLGDYLPWLYNFTPMSGEMTAGAQPQAFQVNGLHFSPNICFESTVPHLIRAQVKQLEREGRPADFLVNITDDGWFKGSTCLDHHFACSIMRSVELRTPTLIAANTGFSGFVDGNGRLLQKGPRREAAFLIAELKPDVRDSLYQQTGDWAAGICLVLSVAIAVLGMVVPGRPRKE